MFIPKKRNKKRPLMGLSGQDFQICGITNKENSFYDYEFTLYCYRYLSQTSCGEDKESKKHFISSIFDGGRT